MRNLTIKTVNYHEAEAEIRAIRRDVFEVEQGVDPALEFDGLDHTAQHLVAYLDHQPVGTARIRELSKHIAKVERLAVLPSSRRQGIGIKLMEKALEVIVQSHKQQVMIHAQEYVQGLYFKLGFEPVGEPFEEAGISHVKMIKKVNNVASKL